MKKLNSKQLRELRSKNTDKLLDEMKSLKDRDLISSELYIYLLEAEAVEWYYDREKGIYQAETIQKIHLN